jgi:reactive intermediate/imine deaminase
VETILFCELSSARGSAGGWAWRRPPWINFLSKEATAEMLENAAVQLIVPDTMPKSVGYSQLAIVSGGKTVFVAGQVAVDKSGNLVGKDDFRSQVKQVFENLKAGVEAAGGSFRDMIKLNIYLLDLSNLPEFREVRDQYIDTSKPPTSTAIQVPRLFRPEFLVEIEAVAVTNAK